MKRKQLITTIILTTLIMTFAGCGGCDGGYKIGGHVLGLDEGESITLQMNLRNDLNVTNDGLFTFRLPAANESFYDVTVLTAPEGKTCSIANNEGYISNSDVTNIDIICGEDTYTIGGTVTGLDLGSSLVIQNNLDDDLTVTNGSFTFETPLADNSYYDVTILTNESGKTCSVENAKAMVMGVNVTNVVIVCSASSYSVGGSVTGLTSGKQILLQNNRHDTLTVTADGTFTFDTKIADGGGYNVTVLKEPAGQNCTVTNESGTISGANITDVSVTCVESKALVMFLLSSRMKSAFLGGVTGADIYCDRDPNCPELGDCKALIADGENRVACTTSNCSGGASEHINWVLQPNRTYIRMDRTTEIGITNIDSIFEFPLTDSVSPANRYVWTGMANDWIGGDTCSKWWTKSSSYYGEQGISDQTDSTMLWSPEASLANKCNYQYGYLYCVEQPDE